MSHSTLKSSVLMAKLSPDRWPKGFLVSPLDRNKRVAEAFAAPISDRERDFDDLSLSEEHHNRSGTFTCTITPRGSLLMQLQSNPYFRGSL